MLGWDRLISQHMIAGELVRITSDECTGLRHRITMQSGLPIAVCRAGSEDYFAVAARRGRPTATLLGPLRQLLGI